MKKLFVILLICSITLIFADDSALDLGKFVIEGEGMILPDSLNEAQIGDSLSSLNVLNALAYQSRPLIITVNEKDLTGKSSKSAIQLLAGNLHQGELNLVTTNDSNINYKLSLSGIYTSIDEDWNSLFTDLNWMTTYKGFNINFHPHYSSIDNPLGETEIIGVGLMGDNMGIDERFIDISFNIDYSMFDQIAQEAEDIDAIVSFDKNLQDWQSKAKFQLLKQAPGGYITLAKKSGFSIFENTGLWLAADSLHVYPSISFVVNHHLSDNINLYLKNEPLLGSESRYYAFINNPYRKVLSDKLQQKKCVNLTAGTDYSSFFDIGFSYNISHIKDYLFYTQQMGSLMMGNYIDILIQDIGLRLGKQWTNIGLYNESHYYLYDEDLPYEKEFSTESSIEINYGTFNIALSYFYATGYEDEMGNSLDDKIMMNASLRTSLTSDISFVFKGENLLNREWQRYTFLPDNAISLQAGVLWQY